MLPWKSSERNNFQRNQGKGSEVFWCWFGRMVCVGREEIVFWEGKFLCSKVGSLVRLAPAGIGAWLGWGYVGCGYVSRQRFHPQIPISMLIWFCKTYKSTPGKVQNKKQQDTYFDYKVVTSIFKSRFCCWHEPCASSQPLLGAFFMPSACESSLIEISSHGKATKAGSW